MSNQGFIELLGGYWPELTPLQRDRVSDFRDVLIEANSKQNLTKLVSPEDFIEGHLLDVKELLSFAGVEYPAMDLGSGGGVPGLLAALIRPDPWILADSETRKADFLSECVARWNLGERVRVVSGRAEEFLAKCDPKSGPRSIVARAVGPVSRIYSWIRTCSTWNNRVLLKGPRWEEEWAAFLDEKGRNQLSLGPSHNYLVGKENKQRIIVRLNRVPRGTKP